MESILVGHVAAVLRYPVKSMAGEELQEAEVRWMGLQGDRRYAFVKADGNKALQVDFPWFTGREYPKLVTYRAQYDADRDAKNPGVTVTTPDAMAYPVESDGLQAHITQQTSKPVSLLRLGRGTYDGAPLSLLSTQTVAEIAKATGVPDTNPYRYRPNILVELAQDTHEDRWVGSGLAIGSTLKIWVTRPDPRCMMINLDPETGTQNPQVLRYVTQARSGNLAVYATVIVEGTVRVGDEIRMMKG